MHKSELIDRLKNVRNMKNSWRGWGPFANYLVYYFDNLHIPHDEEYDFWDIKHYLPELLVDAMEQLRTSADPEIVRFREVYEKEVGREVPNVLDLGASDILNQCGTAQTVLGFLMKEVTGDDWVEKNIEAYCNAQFTVLAQTFDKFKRTVYRCGMYKLIEACGFKGMGGKFGEVELRTYIIAGRIMLTFAKRIDPKKKSHYKRGDDLIYNEWSVSFVGEDQDPLLLSAGIQSVWCDFRTSLDLIEAVIKNWPEDPKAQKKLFRADKKICVI